MELDEFLTYLPKGVDVRPIVAKPALRYVKYRVPKHYPFPHKEFLNKVISDTRCPHGKFSIRAGEKDPAKEAMGDWGKSNPARRRNPTVPKAVIYWFFRYSPETSYFLDLAKEIWKDDAELLSRFCFAKEAGKADEAFEVILGRFKSEEARRYRPAASASTDSLLIFLPDPHRTDIHSFAYMGEDKILVLGRDSEVKSLDRFLSDDALFLWAQLAGDAGQGKSRLAWDLIQKARNAGWKAGFWSAPAMPKEDAKTQAFVAYWESWTPERPHLFVIDYVVATNPALGIALQTLMERSETYDHSVRVLLLERQAWNRGGLIIPPGIGQTDEVREKIVQSRNRAAWFDALDAAADRLDLADPAFLFESTDRQGVITLEALSSNHLVTIARDVFKIWSRGQDLAISDDDITSILDRIDGEGRPLYPYFLGQAMADGDFESGWTRDDLLNSVITREQKKRWSVVYDGSPPNFLSDDPAMICAVLATMTGGLRIEDFVEISDVSISEDLLRKTLILVNGPYETLVSGPAEFTPPLLPDLLGEWFVLNVLARRKSKVQEHLIRTAWTLSSIGMAHFIIRASADFPYSTVFKTILRTPPKEKRQNDWYIAAKKVILLRLQNLYGQVGDISSARALYDSLVDLARIHNEPELLELQATAAFNLIVFYDKAGDIAAAHALYDTLGVLARTYDQSVLRELQVMAADNLIISYIDTGDIAAARALYDALDDLALTIDQPEIQEKRSAVAVNLITAHCNAGDLAAAHALYDGLADVARTHDRAQLREVQAKAAVNLSTFYGSFGDIAAARELHEALAYLARTYDQPELLALLAVATINLITNCGNTGDIASARALYNALADLVRSLDRPELRELQAVATANLIIDYANTGDIASARVLYEALADLARTHDQPKLLEQQARAALNLIADYGKAGDNASARVLYDALADLVRTRDQPKLREQLAKAAVNMTILYCQTGDIASARASYDDVADLARNHDQPELREEQASCAYNLITAYGNAGDIASARALYDALANLAHTHDQPELWREQSKAAFNLAAFYGNSGNFASARALYDALAELARSHDQPELRVLQAFAAYNLIINCGNAGDISSARAFYDAVAELARAHEQPELRVLQARAAEAIGELSS